MTRVMKRGVVSVRTVAVIVVAAIGMLSAAAGGIAFAQAQGLTPGLAPDVEIITERMLFTRGPNGPRVLHMIQLVNIGPRLAEQIPLTIPQGAVWLDVPAELTTMEAVAVDPRPLPVGEARQYVLTYELPWQRLPMPIRRSLFYPTEVLEVWVETDELIVRGVNLRPVANEEIGGIRFTVLVSTDLQPHPQWQAVLETATGPGAQATQLERIGQRSDPLDIVRAHPLPGLLLLTAVLLVAGAFFAWRVNERKPLSATGDADGGGDANATSRGESAGAAVPETAGSVSGSSAGTSSVPDRGIATRGEVARLKEAIVQVDVSFQNGELDEDAYVERRNALKQKLVALLGGQTGAGGRSS